jgi:phage shock protein E
MARKHRTTQKKGDRKKQAKAKFPWLWAALGGLVLLVGVGALILWLVQPAPTHPAEITVAEAYGKYQAGTFLVDVRTVEEWNEVRVPGVPLIPLDELDERLDEIPAGEEIVVICRSGNRSKQGREILIEAGFTQVASMQGGIKEWQAAGHPVEEGEPTP